MKGFVCFALLLVFSYLMAVEDNSYDDYEIIYEYEYEYEDIEEISTNRDEKTVKMDEKTSPVVEFGFLKNNSDSTGSTKSIEPLLNDLYLNRTSDRYDCVKRSEARVLIVEEEEEVDGRPDLKQQVNSLQKKLEQVASLAEKIAEGTPRNLTSSIIDEENEQNETANAEISDEESSSELPKKKLSFRERLELQMIERRAQEAEREKLRPKFRLGADCETLICGSCKAIVEEFNHLVYKAASNTSISYIEEVTVGLCTRREVRVRYVDMVADICNNFESKSTGYKNILLKAFEDDNEWEQLLTRDKLNPKLQRICTAVGACSDEQFEFVSEPVVYTQEQWDEKCFVCQAFAHNLEERMQLTRHLTEQNIIPLIAGTCDRLVLNEHYREVCEPLTKGKLVGDIAWIAKMHSESVFRKATDEQAFEDRLCEEIDWCHPWVDPDALREKEAKQTMEEVFF